MLRLKPQFKKRLSADTFIGIDFGSHRIKALALSRRRHGYHLEGMASVVTPNGAIIDHQLHNIPQLVEALTELRASFNLCSNNVATAVTGSSVTTKIVHVPTVFTGEILALHMQQEAAQHIAFPLDEISLDYEILGQSEQHPDRNKVLLSAARTDHIQARVHALHQVGWRTKVVDIGSHALARAVSFLWGSRLEQRIAALDIGAQSMTFIVIEQGEVIHQRLQPLALGISSLAMTEGDNVEQNTELIEQHVQRNIQLFCSHSGQDPPSQICLFGGYPQLPRLAHQLTQALSLSVMLPDFNHAFGHDLSDYSHASAFGTALGLALRCGSPCRI
ncbi:MAG: type IV pilus assembly protein PilM [Oceanisphaera sp.]|uniref:type IV pilus biogenesis protein PilM n=1 Tax=Oceanisphaera sp. TaxID=1929979 RepID=UPI003C731989